MAAPKGAGMLRWAGRVEGHFPGRGIAVRFLVGRGGRERDEVIREDMTKWCHCMFRAREERVWLLDVHAPCIKEAWVGCHQNLRMAISKVVVVKGACMCMQSLCDR